MQVMHTVRGDRRLARFPPEGRFRAWDAADLYLLEAMGPGGPVLVANDAYGALAVGAGPCHSLYDSVLVQEATRRNLEANGLPEASVRFVSTTDDGGYGPFGQILLRLPPSRDYSEFLLRRVRQWAAPGCQLLAAGMVRQLADGIQARLEAAGFEDIQTGPVVKKALLFSARAGTEGSAAAPYGRLVDVPQWDCRLWTLPNVFARRGLDNGTRLLLEQLPAFAPGDEVVDLGCGCGVIGMLAARAQPDARVYCLDASHLAVAAAQETCRLNGVKVDCKVADGLAGWPPESLDWVVSNPPYHDRAVARRLFVQTAPTLKKNGRLLVVLHQGTRYEALLRRCFDGVEQVAARGRYAVWEASKRP